MSKQLDKLVEALPKGLTEAGIEEVASLIDEVVEERVAEEVKLIEAKVKAFLRTKLDELKQTARRELEADDNVIRGYKIFEAIKTLVAAEVGSVDFDNAVAAYEDENAELQEELANVTEQLNNSLNTLSLLESKLERKQEELTVLSEALIDEREKAEVPFKSSESAVMITNEGLGGDFVPDSARENFFLNEDVIRLSKLQRS